MNYKTLQASTSFKHLEKKSSFIAYIFPVNSLEEFKEKQDAIIKKHKDAKHIPYAYRIFVDDIISERYSDDGEPSKTAGFPALTILKKEELVNVGVIIVRIFGGVKLGPAGLMRAFSESVNLALKENKIINKKIKTSYNYFCDVRNVSLLEEILRKEKILYAISNDKKTPQLIISFELSSSEQKLLKKIKHLIS
jgi:uncharacterized YigZ family protein